MSDKFLDIIGRNFAGIMLAVSVVMSLDHVIKSRDFLKYQNGAVSLLASSLPGIHYGQSSPYDRAIIGSPTWEAW